MTKPSRDWFEHAVPNGRKLALCYYLGQYLVAQWEPSSRQWLYVSDMGHVVGIDKEYVYWKPLPDPPDKNEYVHKKTHCLESDPDYV